MKNVLIFFGGVSCEHDVSVITGVLTLNALKCEKYNPIPIYIDENGRWFSGDVLRDISFYKNFDLKKVKSVVLLPKDRCIYEKKKNGLNKIAEVSVALNCLHGLNGEDGSLAGFLTLCDIPFASPSLFASAVSMDKYYTKLLLSGLGVNSLPYVRVCRENFYKNKRIACQFVEKRSTYPVIVKPANLGSSIGIKVVKSGEELMSALENAFKYDGKVIVEKALEKFREINCACYKSGDKYIVSECEEPTINGDMLTFDDKYLSVGTKRFPADIDKATETIIKDTVKKVYRKLDFNGVVRMDFLLSDGEVYLNEINSVPGSLAYYLFCDGTDKISQFLSTIIEDGIDEYLRYKSNEFVYRGGVLNGLGKLKR
ncbi:MAG: D-alanine--D-alanine ligase [Clostridia bacterium]|nr:D-alanine--D-alanine ligase [Clostridia bacterium]